MQITPSGTQELRHVFVSTQLHEVPCLKPAQCPTRMCSKTRCSFLSGPLGAEAGEGKAKILPKVAFLVPVGSKTSC